MLAYCFFLSYFEERDTTQAVSTGNLVEVAIAQIPGQTPSLRVYAWNKCPRNPYSTIRRLINKKSGNFGSKPSKA